MFLSAAYWAAFATHDGALFYLIGMGLLGDLPMLKGVLVMIGHTPSLMLWTLGLCIGAITSWAGWQAGKRPASSGKADPLPA